MWDCSYSINYLDHKLEFNGVSLVSVQYEPDHDCFRDVKFDHNYYISGETEERIEVSTNYRGLKGTQNYQVEVLVNGNCVNTLMIQKTPNGDIYTQKDSKEY